MSYTQTFMLYNGCMMKKQAYVLPNIITAFGLACGLFVIFKASVIDTTTPLHHLLFTSVILLLIAAVADMIDGALARVLSAESEFGVMFDSLADAVSFGVAPSVVFLKSLTLEDNSSLTFFAFMAAMLYSICGVLRLVRFNVNASMIKGDDLAIEAFKKNFTGLPIPAAACCVVEAAPRASKRSIPLCSDGRADRNSLPIRLMLWDAEGHAVRTRTYSRTALVAGASARWAACASSGSAHSARSE